MFNKMSNDEDKVFMLMLVSTIVKLLFIVVFGLVIVYTAK